MSMLNPSWCPSLSQGSEFRKFRIYNSEGYMRSIIPNCFIVVLEKRILDIFLCMLKFEPCLWTKFLVGVTIFTICNIHYINKPLYKHKNFWCSVSWEKDIKTVFQCISMLNFENRMDPMFSPGVTIFTNQNLYLENYCTWIFIPFVIYRSPETNTR